MALFTIAQAGVVTAAREEGYYSEDESERTLLCPECGRNEGILFHKEGEPDVLACPCGYRE